MTCLAPHPQSMATCLPLHQLLYKLQVAELQVQLQLMTTPALATGSNLSNTGLPTGDHSGTTS